MSIIIGIMSLTIGGILLYLPPIGTTIGILIILLSFLAIIYLFRIQLELTSERLVIHRMWSVKAIELSHIKSISRMRVIGTVANAPISIRNVTLATDDGEITIRTLFFTLREVLDVLDELNQLIDHPEEDGE